MTSRRTHALAALAALTFAACGGDDGGDDFGSGDFSVTAALGQLPVFDDGDSLQISMADLVAATEANGVERPESADDDDVFEWLFSITGGDADSSVFVLPPEPVASGVDPTQYESVTGFSFVDADVFAAVGAPPDQFTVFAGERIEDDQLDDDLVEVADGVVSTSDNDDYEQDLVGDLIVDRVGRPVRFAQDGNRLAASLSTPQVEDWLAGDDQTLADDESLVAVAEALDDAAVVSAALFTFDEGEGGPDPRTTPEARERLGLDDLPDGSARTIGIGWSVDDDDFPITVVYDFGDEDAAAEWAETLEDAYRDGVSVVRNQPISDLLELDAIEASGPLVVATVQPGPAGRPGTPIDMLFARDLPFITTA